MAELGATLALQILVLQESEVEGLHSMLAALEDAGDARHFQPHPFDKAHILGLATRPGQDLHYLALLDQQVVAYGLLRGWNEGYAVPSLGIAVHPDFRGLGIADALMQFLHAAARLRGSRQVRLRVVSSNTRAISLYKRIGYRFDAGVESDNDAQSLLVAFKDFHV